VLTSENERNIELKFLRPFLLRFRWHLNLKFASNRISLLSASSQFRLLAQNNEQSNPCSRKFQHCSKRQPCALACETRRVWSDKEEEESTKKEKEENCRRPESVSTHCKSKANDSELQVVRDIWALAESGDVIKLKTVVESPENKKKVRFNRVNTNSSVCSLIGLNLLVKRSSKRPKRDKMQPSRTY